MKKLLCMLLVCLLAVTVVGCSGGNKGNESGEKVTLRIGMPGGKDVTPMEIVEEFKKAHPEITVEVDDTPWGDFMKRLNMQIATDDAPDVYILDSGTAASYGAKGALTDLSELVEKDLNTDDYINALYAGLDSDGKLWGVPHGINPVAVYYNKTLFDEAGLDYPEADWTFDDMLEMAKKLTKDVDGDGQVDRYGISYPDYITSGWLPFVTATGGAPLDETRTKSMFNDEKTIEGIKRYLQAEKEDKSAPDKEWQAAHQNNVVAFYTGNLAMMISQSSDMTAINASKQPGFEYDVQMLPIGWDGERHCVYVPNEWVINAKSSDAAAKAAWEFIKFYMNEESQKTIAEQLLAGFPTKKSALKHLEGREMTPANVKAFYEGIDEAGVTIFENATYTLWLGEAEKYIRKIRAGTVSFDEGIELMHQEVTKALAQ